MENNVYEKPEADLGNEAIVEVPEDIAKKIKSGWIAALVSGVMTLALMLVAMNTGSLNHLFDIWTSIDVVLIFALAFGIYKKSRVAATMMFIYFLLSKIWLVVETGQTNNLLISALFLYFYLQAMVGTFQYHKLMKSEKGAS